MAFDSFEYRHIGPREQDLDKMFEQVGVSSMDDLIERTVPKTIRTKTSLDLKKGISEYEYLDKIKG